MLSPLDLETRRKILFADDDFTVRSLGADAVLVTMISKKVSQHGIENVGAFLCCKRQSSENNSLIVDITQASRLTLNDTLALRSIRNQGFQRFAMLTRKFRLRLLVLFLFSNTRSTHFRLFKD
jgi:hypothetical protein